MANPLKFSCKGRVGLIVWLGGAPGRLFVRVRGEAPARHCLPVCPVRLVELGLKCRFLVENHEQMEGDEGADGVLENGSVTEEPRLAQENGENAVVHGVPSVAIQATYDELTRWIDRRQCAFAPGEEVPDAAKKNDDTGEDENAGRHRGNAEGGKMRPA